MAISKNTNASAVVVGAGAAGVLAVGKILEQLEQNGFPDAKVSWFDPKFEGGRVDAKYREVPGNTKTCLFVRYANAASPLRRIVDAATEPNAVTVLEGLPGNETCRLGYAADMLQMLTRELMCNPRVDAHHGRVTEARWNDASQTWSLAIHDQASGRVQHCSTPMMVFCTGSSPRTVPLPGPLSSTPKLLDLDTALKPSLLQDVLLRDRQVTVGVVGASHSAILVLMNLFELAQTTHSSLRIRWFARSTKLKFAEEKDGWTLYDNTGLKGRAAQFARECLNEGMLDTSTAGKFISRIDCSGGVDLERTAMMRELPDCDHVVQAVGYDRDPLPILDRNVVFNHTTGGFGEDASGAKVSGLYGAGIAFPERVVDPMGNVEYAVGFFKFVNFLARVVPAWVKESRPQLK